MPFSVADVVNDPDFAESYTILRSQDGSWQQGKWVDAQVTLAGYGVVQPATNQDLDMVPEGDRVSGAFLFHSSSPLYETQVNPSNAISDILVWQGQQFRILAVQQWQDYGYWQALAVRMLGA